MEGGCFVGGVGEKVKWNEGWSPFDTRRMVYAFERAGFTPFQARVVNNLLCEVMTARERENRALLASKGDYMKVKTELKILEKSDFQLLRSDVEHLETNIEKNIARVNTELERSTHIPTHPSPSPILPPPPPSSSSLCVLFLCSLSSPPLVENRVIKYVLGSSFFFGLFGTSLWFLHKNVITNGLTYESDVYSPEKSFTEVH